MALFIDRLVVSSPDFDQLAPIPAEFSADGGNRAPRIEFGGAPEGTVEYALICHDPDAPLPNGFTHWAVFGIPADATRLDGVALRFGPNGIGEAGWFGPQPPVGHGVHHYYFWLYALSAQVQGSPNREEFLADCSDAIIEQARLVGTFER